MKLDGDLYDRLRLLKRQREDSGSGGASHQEILVEALVAFLTREGR